MLGKDLVMLVHVGFALVLKPSPLLLTNPPFVLFPPDKSRLDQRRGPRFGLGSN